MLKQTFEVAKIVITSSLRKKIVTASLLIMIPLLLAAWLFEASNPGFQTGFILDAGGGLMSLLAIIIILILSFEHLFWLEEERTPWFYFSRLKSRVIFPIGKFLGISLVFGIILAVFAILLTLLIYFTSGVCIFSSIKISFMVWAEYNVFLSILVLFSTFFSKFMSVGMMLPVFFLANSIQYLKSLTANQLLKILMIVLPDVRVFYEATESGEINKILLAFLYSIFISSFYLTLAALILRRKDL